jgi:hypothetical protein
MPTEQLTSSSTHQNPQEPRYAFLKLHVPCCTAHGDFTPCKYAETKKALHCLYQTKICGENLGNRKWVKCLPEFHLSG